MKILFDQGVPVPLRSWLSPDEVATAYEMDWSGYQNGMLISQAEAFGFQVLVTTDQNLKYQQNLSERAITIVVLLTTSWPRIKKQADGVAGKIRSAKPGDYIEIEIA